MCVLSETLALTPEYTNCQEIYIFLPVLFHCWTICCINISCEHMVSLTDAHVANSFIRDVTSESRFPHLPAEEADREVEK